jgi:hypothetical protein
MHERTDFIAACQRKNGEKTKQRNSFFHKNVCAVSAKTGIMQMRIFDRRRRSELRESRWEQSLESVSAACRPCACKWEITAPVF